MSFVQNLIAGVGTRAAGAVAEEVGAFATGGKGYLNSFKMTHGQFWRWSVPGMKSTFVRGLETFGINSGRTAAQKILPFALKTVATAGINTLVWGGGPQNTTTQDGVTYNGQQETKQEAELRKLTKDVQDIKKQISTHVSKTVKDNLDRDLQFVQTDKKIEKIQ